jgi:hypothetical protein
LREDLLNYRDKNVKNASLRNIEREIKGIPCQILENERGFSHLQDLFKKKLRRLSDESLTSLYFFEAVLRK